MRLEWQINMKWKRCGSRWMCPSSKTVPDLPVELMNTTKNLSILALLWSEIWTRDLRKCCSLQCDTHYPLDTGQCNYQMFSCMKSSQRLHYFHSRPPLISTTGQPVTVCLPCCLCSSLKTVAIFVVDTRLWVFLRPSVIISLRYYVLWRRMVWYTPTKLSEKILLFQSWT
jgi:hypothetical protein